MERLRDRPEDLIALCAASANFLGIPDPAFVEKDFWVVELLRSVFRPLPLEPLPGVPCSARPLFKGGTSLSKAYRLMTRFSEDVDILLVVDGYGETATDKRVLKPICARVTTDMGLAEGAAHLVNATTGIKRTVDYEYPRLLLTETIRPFVQLEMGVRGVTIPGVQVRQVQSYIAEYLLVVDPDTKFEELAQVEVEALSPVRTLVEKLALLHHAGVKALAGDELALLKHGRHFYDVYRLLRNDDVVSALRSATSPVAVISEDSDAFSARYGWPYSPRPVDGYAASPVFASSGVVLVQAERAYQLSIGLVWGPRPTLSDCIEAVRAAASLL